MQVGTHFDQLVQQPSEETTGPPNRVFRVHTRSVPRREVIAPHYHGDLEMVVFDDIQGETIVDGIAYHVSGQALHCIGPDAVHSFALRGMSDNSRVWVLQMNLDYFGDCIARSDPQLAQALHQRVAQRPVADPHSDAELRSLVTKLAQDDAPPGADPRFAGKLGVLFTILGKLDCGQPPTPSNKPNPQTRALMHMIASYADRPVSLDELSRRCSLSKFHLCRTFKRQTGMTVNEYLTRMRILRAQQLMATGGRTVTRACYESGFGSASYFIAVFSRIVGATPKQWALERTG